MSPLRRTLREYVSLRRGLGHKFVAPAISLEGFITFMEQRDNDFVTTKIALDWACRSPGKHASRAINLAHVRGFSRHLQSIDPRTEVPPVGLLPYGGSAKPYIYSDSEIKALLDAALTLHPVNGLRRWTYHCLFGLLPVTGLRISEALALKRRDVDLEGCVLTVCDTKFGKSRYVPIHSSTQRVLIEYARRRDAHIDPPRSEYFLVAERGGRLLPQYVSPVFLVFRERLGYANLQLVQGPEYMISGTVLLWQRCCSGTDLGREWIPCCPSFPPA